MKRALCLLVLVAACSNGSHKAAPSPTPPPSEAATPTATATASPSPTASRTAGPPIGPIGTKVPTGFHPMSATFISDRTGWVLGASPCPTGNGSCDVIARTRDAGATWRAIPSPRTSPDHLAQIRFANERDGFVTGDQLWATHDGGATWSVVPGEDGDGLAIAAGRAWYAVDSHLYSSPVTSVAFVQEPGDHQTSVTVHGPLAVSGNYATGASLFVQRHGQEPSTVGTPCDEMSQAVVGLGSATHWFLVCEGDAGLGHQDKHAFESFDAGRTWKSAGDPPQLTGTDIYVTGDGDFVVDHQEVAVRRGGSWHVALASDGGITEGGFESAALGYAIGGFDGGANELMKITHDAGRTWKTVAF